MPLPIYRYNGYPEDYEPDNDYDFLTNFEYEKMYSIDMLNPDDVVLVSNTIYPKRGTPIVEQIMTVKEFREKIEENVLYISPDKYNEHLVGLLKSLDIIETLPKLPSLSETERKVPINDLYDLLRIERRIIKYCGGCSRTIHTLCRLLLAHRDPSNIWKIWRLKCINNDTYCSLDIRWIYLHFDNYEDLIRYICTHYEQVGQLVLNSLLKRIEDDRNTWLKDKPYPSEIPDASKLTEEYILYG